VKKQTAYTPQLIRLRSLGFPLLGNKLHNEYVPESAKIALDLLYLNPNKFLNELENNPSALMVVFRTRDLFVKLKKLDIKDIFTIVGKFTPYLRHFWPDFNRPPIYLVDNMPLDIVLHLGQYDLEFAKNLLRRRKFSNLQAAQLGQHSLQIAQYILENRPLNGSEIAQLGKYNFEIAQMILDQPSLVEKLSGRNLATLGQRLPTIAMRIIESPELSKRVFDEQNIAKLGRLSPRVARYILTKEIFMGEFELSPFLADLGGFNDEIANEILDNPELSNQLSEEELAFIGRNNLDTAKHVLVRLDEQYQNHSHCLRLLGEYNPSIAEYIIKNYDLESDELLGMGLNNIETAKMIISKMPERLDSLSSVQIRPLYEFVRQKEIEAEFKEKVCQIFWNILSPPSCANIYKCGRRDDTGNPGLEAKKLKR